MNRNRLVVHFIMGGRLTHPAGNENKEQIKVGMLEAQMVDEVVHSITT